MRPSLRRDVVVCVLRSRDVVVCVLRSTSQQQTFELSFSHHSPPLPPEHINDEIDETNIFVFGLRWVFVPEYPLYQVVSKASDAHSYIDEVAKFVYGIGTLVGACSWIMMLIRWKELWTSLRRDYEKKYPGHFTKKFFFEKIFDTIRLTSITIILLSLCFFCYAALNYIVIWWIVPSFFNTFVFYFHIFLFIPFTVFAILLGLISYFGPQHFQAARYYISAIASVSHHFLLLIGAIAVLRLLQDYYRRHFRS